MSELQIGGVAIILLIKYIIFMKVMNKYSGN